MLHVEGSNDKARRASLGKMINKWINQTYELDDQTVRLVRGPRYKNRYLTWILPAHRQQGRGVPFAGDRSV